MNGVGLAVLGCATAFVAGAFVIDTVGEFLIGVAVTFVVGTIAAGLIEATK